MDIKTKEARSINMSHIRGKDTGIETKVRKALWKDGFRYRKNVTSMPGKPDIVLPKYKTVIFVNGCFWHHHKDCRYAYIPKSNVAFWKQKFEKNIERDQKNTESLTQLGWNVITIWECELKKDQFLQRLYILENQIKENLSTEKRE